MVQHVPPNPGIARPCCAGSPPVTKQWFIVSVCRSWEHKSSDSGKKTSGAQPGRDSGPS
eukprot:NODE_8369_length_521_cov_2.832627_g7310_i0.p3 GENE.NODE_8369_length_521_cov_2.832627_g7310_i0~~NODE_8369_length_521_cov_2.832627_g7310_i0.p3  ORF type:complete len:59 (-),score=1.15 NODE_8369_length_521_cov_2.832627_g7310_i0:8-184(-)